jgi:hypothetical protein
VNGVVAQISVIIGIGCSIKQKLHKFVAVDLLSNIKKDPTKIAMGSWRQWHASLRQE